MQIAAEASQIGTELYWYYQIRKGHMSSFVHDMTERWACRSGDS